MVFNLILVFPLQHAGLALATALSAFLNAGLLYRGLHRDGVYQPAKGWLAYLIRLILANLAMASALLWLVADIDQWLAWSLWQRVSQTAFLVFTGIGIYGATLLISGVRPRHLRL